MKQCTDPTFLGTAIHAYVEGRPMKLSRLQELWDNGAVTFDTMNTTYQAVFTDEATRRAFLAHCKTVLSPEKYHG